MKKNKKAAEPTRFRPNRQMLRPTAFMMVLCGIGAFSVLGLRLYQLMILDHQRYEAMAIEQQMRSVPSSVNRGTIYDREQAVRDYDVINGAGAIAMDVNNGAILGMASLGNYDPNHFPAVSPEDQQYIDEAEDEQEREKRISKAQIRQWRNKALSDTYEPGSTFKMITLAMALEEGATDQQDSFYCPGSVEVLGRSSPIRCWKHEGHGSQDLTQARDALESCGLYISTRSLLSKDEGQTVVSQSIPV